MNNTFNVLIVGAGNIAAFFDAPNSNKILTHAHAFTSSKEFSLLGFYDVDYSKAIEAADRWNCKAFENLDSAMSEVDVVCCCVPDQFHADILKELAKYPVKLVVTEKPITRTMDEAEEIVYIYNKKKLPLLLNYSRRFLPEFEQLRDKISSYGRFMKGTGYYGKGIQHNGSHMIDILSFLLRGTCCNDAPHNILRDFDCEDFSCDVMLKIADGYFNMVAIDCRVATIFEMDLFFEKTRVRIIDSGTKIEIYNIKESLDYAGYYNYILSEEIDVDYSNAMVGMVKNVQDFLLGNAELKCTLEDGVNVLSTCLKIRGDI